MLIPKKCIISPKKFKNENISEEINKNEIKVIGLNSKINSKSIFIIKN